MAVRPLSIDIRRPLILEANQLALLTREDGDIPAEIPGFGLFYKDTCWLRAYGFRLDGAAPLLLMSSDARGFEARIGLTNQRMRAANGEPIEDHKLDIQRALLLPADGMTVVDRIEIRNASDQTVNLPLSLSLGTRFESLFRLRGSDISTRGQLQAPVWDGERLIFTYAGADKVRRRLLVTFNQPASIGPATTDHTEAFFIFRLEPLEQRALLVTMRLEESALDQPAPAPRSRRSRRTRPRRWPRPPSGSCCPASPG